MFRLGLIRERAQTRQAGIVADKAA